MSDKEPIKSITQQTRCLTLKFIGIVIIATVLVVALLSFLALRFTQNLALQVSLDQLESQVNEQLLKKTKPVEISEQLRLQLVATRLATVSGVSEVLIFDTNKKLLWPHNADKSLTQYERESFDSILNDPLLTNQVVNPLPDSIDKLMEMMTLANTHFSSFIAIYNNQNEPSAILKVVSDYRVPLSQARSVSNQLVWPFFLSCILMSIFLFYIFWKSMQTIGAQEHKMNQQISRLSNLLTINKTMQSSIRSASRRAVELNEQFLRRVGSDLHDGPAQSIGYSVLRLDKITKEQDSPELSHEFNIVKEALDDALEEIRGISAGLVLPELQEMTLAEAIDKVVSKHESNTNTEVSQYYQNLPEQVTMPVKICAYRFVQEGLNNAFRHGDATKCRVSVQAKEEVLHLTLKDNGIGFRLSQLKSEGEDKGLGLMGLRDRIESVGGTFAINSELGVGTSIKVKVPLSD